MNGKYFSIKLLHCQPTKCTEFVKITRMFTRIRKLVHVSGLTSPPPRSAQVCTTTVKTFCHLLFLKLSYELERRICAQYLGAACTFECVQYSFLPFTASPTSLPSPYTTLSQIYERKSDDRTTG